MPRYLQTIAFLLLGAVLGLLGFYRKERAPMQRERTMSLWAEEALADVYAKAQYRDANRQIAREALLYAIALHEKVQARHTTRNSSGQIDLGYCHGELALLEESEGHAELARGHMEQAQRALRDSGFRESRVSEARIRADLAKEPFVAVAGENRP